MLQVPAGNSLDAPPDGLKGLLRGHAAVADHATFGIARGLIVGTKNRMETHHRAIVTAHTADQPKPNELERSASEPMLRVERPMISFVMPCTEDGRLRKLVLRDEETKTFEGTGGR